MLEHLKAHLQGKCVVMGIGSALRSDDAVGSLLAAAIKDRVPYIVYDSGSSPENYFGKIVKDNPDNVVLIDAADFGGAPGEFRAIEGKQLEDANFFSTHNSSLPLAINYLKSEIKADIIVLIIQPKSTSFGDKLSPEVGETLHELENWFISNAEKKR